MPFRKINAKEEIEKAIKQNPELAKEYENLHKETKRIVIDCTKEEHKEFKKYCADKGVKMGVFGLKAIKEKMEREA